MLSLLHEQLVETSILSVLYSDVGNYYSRAKRLNVIANESVGWKIISPYQVVWPTAKPNVVSPSSLQVRLVAESDFQAICERDAELLKAEISAYPVSAFAIIPTDYQIDRLVRLCKYHESILHPECKRKQNWGVELGDSRDGSWSFAIWSLHFSKRELMIQRLRCRTPEELHTILVEAQKVAWENGMERITAWNVGRDMLEGTGWQNVERPDALPALIWYGTGEVPSTWIANEHFAWC